MNSNKFLPLLLICNIALPVFKANFPSNQGYYFLLLASAALTLFNLIYCQKRISLLFLSLITLLSLSWFTPIFFSVNPVYRDLLECFRPILYGCWFYIGLKTPSAYLFKCLNFSLEISLFLLTFLVVNTIFKISPFIGGLYSSMDFYYFNRFSGVFSNPYDLGCYLALAFPYCLHKFIVLPSFSGRLKSLAFLLSISCMVLYSQSRTSFIGIFLTLIVILAYNLKYFSRNFALSIIAFLTLLSTLIFRYSDFIFSDKFTYLTRGLRRFFAAQNVSSFDTRINQFDVIWLNDNLFTFLFGHGSGFGLPEVFMESQYALYFYRYGLLAFSVLLLLFIVTVIRCCRLLFLLHSDWLYASPIRVSVLVWLLVFPILCLSNAYIDISRISLIYFISLGAIFSKHFVFEVKSKSKFSSSFS